MTQTTSDPAWKHDSDARISLSGSWTLLVDKHQRRRLLNELEHIGSAREYCWDLRKVDALDSTGALVLWKVWNGELPARVDCNDDQRHLLQRLADAPPLEQPTRDQPNFPERFGGGVVAVLKVAGGMLMLVGQLLLDVAFCVRHPRITPWKEISANIYRIGATSMLLLGCIGFLVGAVMTIQIGLALDMFGASNLVVGMMATAVPRELGAVLIGLLMAGRTGSAMTASIGAMHITEEYSALRAFGSSPSLRLALPRVIGAAVAMTLLVVWVDCATLLGGAVAAPITVDIDYRLFLQQCVAQVQLVNVWIGLGKGMVFGLVIALVGCYFGMRSSPDTESLSRNTTLAVVTSLTLVLLIDASLGAALTNVGLV